MANQGYLALKQKKASMLESSPSKAHISPNPSVSPLNANMDKSSALASKNGQFLGLGPSSLSNMNNRDCYANSNSIFHNQMSPHEGSTNQSLNFQSASCLHRQNPTQNLD